MKEGKEFILIEKDVVERYLQGTINKKVCLLEIGVGMKYPSVIRWPFEKITFYNQKSELFRVHSRLYQISEEIKDRREMRVNIIFSWMKFRKWTVGKKWSTHFW